MNDQCTALPGAYDADTYITFGTSAEYAYDLYLAKQRQIEALQYECDMLVDQYTSQMKRANIPFVFREPHLMQMFGTDNEKAEARKTAREMFLEQGFSKPFLKAHKVDLVDYQLFGPFHTAITIVLEIGDFIYSMEFPQPDNIKDYKDKKHLIGQVKFRVDRIHKSHKDDFVKKMEPVTFPTYNWKDCFTAIEMAVKSTDDRVLKK